MVYAKPPFAGPEAVLTYLSRYTHQVAISNRRLVSADQHHVAFRYKNYRAEHSKRWQTMTLEPHEFIRRFLLHVLPKGFHRIRHYGLFAGSSKADNLKIMRALLKCQEPQGHQTGETENSSSAASEEDQNAEDAGACPCCGGRMIIIEVFDAGCEPRYKPEPEGLDSS